MDVSEDTITPPTVKERLVGAYNSPKIQKTRLWGGRAWRYGVKPTADVVSVYLIFNGALKQSWYSSRNKLNP